MFRKALAALLVFSLIVPPNLYAQSSGQAGLPMPGTMLSLSKPYMPVMVKGLLVHPEHPFKFDFIIDSGDTGFKGAALKAESMKLIKYFLAALTVPEEEMWVNLSPYEKDRMIPKTFGDTDMGRDLLAQDYILKQLTASLTYPEKEMGKTFWDKVYEQAQTRFGTTNIPVNTFNKVWIVPQKAGVYEHANGAFVIESKLKVMTEQDYLALNKNSVIARSPQGDEAISKRTTNDVNALGAKIIRTIIIPALEKEVNEGSHFANLRQIYQAMILATWYKIRLKDSILGKLYVDQHKTKGVAWRNRDMYSLRVPISPEAIYQQYLRAFKKGVYNYIKEDVDPATRNITPRKYVSGGFSTDTGAGGLRGLVSQNMTSNPNLAMAAEPPHGDLFNVKWEGNKDNPNVPAGEQQPGTLYASTVQWIASYDQQLYGNNREIISTIGTVYAYSPKGGEKRRAILTWLSNHPSQLAKDIVRRLKIIDAAMATEGYKEGEHSRVTVTERQVFYTWHGTDGGVEQYYSFLFFPGPRGTDTTLFDDGKGNNRFFEGKEVFDNAVAFFLSRNNPDDLGSTKGSPVLYSDLTFLPKMLKRSTSPAMVSVDEFSRMSKPEKIEKWLGMTPKERDELEKTVSEQMDLVSEKINEENEYENGELVFAAREEYSALAGVLKDIKSLKISNPAMRVEQAQAIIKSTDQTISEIEKNGPLSNGAIINIRNLKENTLFGIAQKFPPLAHEVAILSGRIDALLRESGAIVADTAMIGRHSGSIGGRTSVTIEDVNELFRAASKENSVDAILKLYKIISTGILGSVRVNENIRNDVWLRWQKQPELLRRLLESSSASAAMTAYEFKRGKYSTVTVKPTEVIYTWSGLGITYRYSFSFVPDPEGDAGKTIFNNGTGNEQIFDGKEVFDEAVEFFLSEDNPDNLGSPVSYSDLTFLPNMVEKSTNAAMATKIEEAGSLLREALEGIPESQNQDNIIRNGVNQFRGRVQLALNSLKETSSDEILGAITGFLDSSAHAYLEILDTRYYKNQFGGLLYNQQFQKVISARDILKTDTAMLAIKDFINKDASGRETVWSQLGDREKTILYNDVFGEYLYLQKKIQEAYIPNQKEVEQLDKLRGALKSIRNFNHAMAARGMKYILPKLDKMRFQQGREAMQNGLKNQWRPGQSSNNAPQRRTVQVNEKKQKDQALIAKGGIDLNTKKGLDFEIKRDDKGMPLPVQLQNLQELDFETLYPEILSIGEVLNFSELLGLDQNPPQKQAAV